MRGKEDIPQGQIIPLQRETGPRPDKVSRLSHDNIKISVGPLDRFLDFQGDVRFLYLDSLKDQSFALSRSAHGGIPIGSFDLKIQSQLSLKLPANCP